MAASGSTKCQFHRNRSKCIENDCLNQAYARGRCVRHGAKQRCIVDSCQQHRRLGPYCSKHAQDHRKKKCGVDGCEKQPHARGKCVRHGGGRFCKADGCTYHARIGAFCARHGEKVPKVSIPSVEPLQPHELATLHDNDALDWAILNDLIFGEKWHTNCVKYDAPHIDSVDFALETDRIEYGVYYNLHSLSYKAEL
ncbi:unnamed protein product [Aphanomyces euteiches]